MSSTVNAAIPLSVATPPPAQGPLDQARAGMSLQALINETRLQQQQSNAVTQQQQQIQLQQQQQDFEDTQKLRQAFMESGGDWGQTMQKAQALGVNPQKIFQLQTQHIGQLTAQAQLHKDVLDNGIKLYDLDAKDAQAIRALPPEERQQAWTLKRNQRLADGTHSADQIPIQVPDDNGLQEIEYHSKALLDDLNAAADLKKKQEADPAVAAENQQKKIQSGAAMLANATSQPTYDLLKGTLKKQGFTDDDFAQYPQTFSPDAVQQLKNIAIGPVEQAKLFGTGAAADMRYRNIQQQVNLRQPVSPADAAWAKAYEKQKELNTTTRINLQNNAGGLIPGGGAGGGGNGSGGSPTAAQIPPQIAPQVKAVLEYRGAMPPAGRNNATNQAIRYWVNAIDPQYDETTFPQRNKILNEYVKSAGEGQIGSINTALGHLGELEEARKAAASSDIPLLNNIAAKVGAVVGGDAATTYTAILHRVGPEMTSAYVKGGGGEGERGANLDDFALSKGDKQIALNIAESAKLLNSKLASERNNWNQTFKPYRDSDTFDNRFITPDARTTLTNLASRAPTNPQAHKVGDVVTQNGHNFIATAVDANGKVSAARPQ